MVETLRTFMALDIGKDVKTRLQAAIDSLKIFSRGVKWTQAESIHLTLVFLGNISADLVGDVAASVTTTCRGFEPFSYEVKGLGVFGGNRPRVIWCGIEDTSGTIERLHDGLVRSLEGLGFPREERGFHPHLTLGRVRKPTPAPALRKALTEGADFNAGRGVADHATFFKSTLTPNGPLYESLARIPLGEDA